LIPRQIRKAHCFELIDIVNFRGVDRVIVPINGSRNEFATVVSFEATNDAGVVWLDMGGEVWPEILDRNVGEAIRNDVTTEVILQHQNMPTLCS
jgi:hypothetical protein